MVSSSPPRESLVAGPVGEARSARYVRQRERILDAAAAVLNMKGVRGMTLLEVAEGLGLRTTSVTYYFRYKEQLVAAVIEDSLDRLAAMVSEAAQHGTPRERVSAYVRIYFDQFGKALRGKARPLATFSEIRALEEPLRDPLIDQYQAVFRAVRALFGEPADAAEKEVFTARAHILNEALFWSVTWLRNYDIGDFGNVHRRVMDLFDRGIAAPGAVFDYDLVDPEAGQDAHMTGSFLRVATRLINDIGYRGASVDRITAELKLSKGSFYHYLEAKDELVLDCFRNSYRRLKLLQTRADQSGGVWRSLVSGLASALELQFAGDYPLLRSTALQAMPPRLREVAIERTNRTALALTGVLLDCMAEGSIRLVDPLIASHLIMSSVNSAYDLRVWANRQPRAKAIETYANVVLNGLF